MYRLTCRWIFLSCFVSNAYAGEITVSAAASLTDAFKEIAARFEASTPDTKVALNFGASGALLQQIDNGAPVDVFAAADQETMDLAEQKALLVASERQNFASNALVVIVPSDSTFMIDTLAQLGSAKLKHIAIGAPASVPVGRYSQRALEKAGLWPTVQEKMISTQNVRQALDYVARAEVDAGLVYVTDAFLMKGKVKIALSVPTDPAISYPIAVMANTTNRSAAARFVAFVLAPDGQAILTKFGFSKP